MITLKAFGSVKEEIGDSIRVDEDCDRVADLRKHLSEKYPSVQWSSVVFAINKEYAEENSALSEGDEIALIPPVSGG